jgi:hypothetical protein
VDGGWVKGLRFQTLNFLNPTTLQGFQLWVDGGWVKGLRFQTLNFLNPTTLQGFQLWVDGELVSQLPAPQLLGG